jgi:glutamate racemase
VLGCTHYPFVAPLIKDIIGADRTLINPAPAVARQLVRVLSEQGLQAPAGSLPNYQLRFSGKGRHTEALSAAMLGVPFSIDHFLI